MKTEDLTLERVLEDFLQLLDDDILNMELSLIRLDELRSAVIKREDGSLQNLVETIRIQNEDHEKVNCRREKVIHQIAEYFDIEAKNVNVTFLLKRIAGSNREVLLHKQQTLEKMVEKIRAEYSATVMFIQEFSRINKMMLNGIFGSAGSGVVYNEKGKSRHEIERGMISGRF